MKQGASVLATPAKQDGLYGIQHMYTLMHSRIPGTVFFADLFSGTGVNNIENTSVDGSPITALKAFHKAINSTKKFPLRKYQFVFNDIVEGRADVKLKNLVHKWANDTGITIEEGENFDTFSFKTKNGFVITFPVYFMNKSADEIISVIHEHMEKKDGSYFQIFIDPNGPKDFPWESVNQLYEKFPSRLTIAAHLSATALKRVAACKRARPDLSFVDMPDHVKGVIGMFAKHPKGWVRKPVGADQWTMFFISRFSPKGDWQKQGFHHIGEQKGKEIIHLLSTTAKERQ